MRQCSQEWTGTIRSRGITPSGNRALLSASFRLLGAHVRPGRFRSHPGTLRRFGLPVVERSRRRFADLCSRGSSPTQIEQPPRASTSGWHRTSRTLRRAPTMGTNAEPHYRLKSTPRGTSPPRENREGNRVPARGHTPTRKCRRCARSHRAMASFHSGRSIPPNSVPLRRFCGREVCVPVCPLPLSFSPFFKRIPSARNASRWAEPDMRRATSVTP